jgi:hypothetical protein
MKALLADVPRKEPSLIQKLVSLGCLNPEFIKIDTIEDPVFNNLLYEGHILIPLLTIIFQQENCGTETLDAYKNAIEQTLGCQERFLALEEC